MKAGKQLHFVEREDWRAWLEANHANEKEIWVVFYKKHTGKPTLPYDDVVEEALCFGWIDGLLKRVDDEKYIVRCTPRRPKSVWSELNKKRARKTNARAWMLFSGLRR